MDDALWLLIAMTWGFVLTMLAAYLWRLWERDKW